MEGLKQLFKTASAIQGHFDPRYIRAINVLLTFVENNTLLSRDVQQQMRGFFGDLVFDTVIHKSVRLAEAPGAGEPILAFAPESRAAIEYRVLAQEVIDGWTLFEEIRSLAKEITENTTPTEPTINHEVSVG
jgi:chromosome partitioning protein